MNEMKEKKKYKEEVTITGFGGQGIILAGRILGMAASLGDKKESTLVQSYGPESRGGACSAQVVISNKSIHHPYIKNSDILVCMSHSGYEKYIDSLKTEGLLLIDQDLVHPTGRAKDSFFPIAATRMAEELGRTMMANIIMLGFLTAITNIVSLEAMKKAVTESVPKGTEDNNINAFNKGFDSGLAFLKASERKAAGQTGAIS